MMKVAVWAMTLVPLAVSGQNDSTRVFDENHPLVYEDAWDLWPYAFLTCIIHRGFLISDL